MAKTQPKKAATQKSEGIKNTRSGPHPRVYVSLGQIKANKPSSGTHHPSYAFCRVTTATHFGLAYHDFVQHINKSKHLFLPHAAHTHDLVLVDSKGVKFSIAVPKTMSVAEMHAFAANIKSNKPKKIITPGGKHLFITETKTPAATTK